MTNVFTVKCLPLFVATDDGNVVHVHAYVEYYSAMVWASSNVATGPVHRAWLQKEKQRNRQKYATRAASRRPGSSEDLRWFFMPHAD